jgi:MSHA biogenesis protein MshM
MYYAHFGLTQAPFKITPNTEFFYGGGNRGPILEALIYAVTHGEGIVKVTGEVGSGKTMLCNMLQARLPAHIESVYLANPSVSAEEILHAIAFDLQLPVDRTATRLEAMHALQQHLVKRHAEGRRVVIFIEESQSMPLETLEEIRLLSNLETKNDKLLQIVLFGQPELDTNLRQQGIRQLRERITHSFRLEPLDVDEIREYLMFRMRAAGYRGPDLFSSAVVRHIARVSAGLTRRVNLIADKALLAAFSENTHNVKLNYVKAAVRDSEFSYEQPARSPLRLGWGMSLVSAGAVVGFLAYALIDYQRATVPAPQGGLPKSALTAPAAGPVSVVQASAHVPNIEELRSGDTLAATAVGTETDADVTAKMVQARLAATDTWLKNEPQTTFSIQIFGAQGEEQLRNHLNVIGKSIEINQLFVYRTVAKGKPSLTVLYGSFSDRQAAQDAIARLPASLKANRPLLRTVQGVRAEIKQHES